MYRLWAYLGNRLVAKTLGGTPCQGRGVRSIDNALPQGLQGVPPDPFGELGSTTVFETSTVVLALGAMLAAQCKHAKGHDRYSNGSRGMSENHACPGTSMAPRRYAMFRSNSPGKRGLYSSAATR
jgi:hypothetical protein